MGLVTARLGCWSLLVLAASLGQVRAGIHRLDDNASPIQVDFDDGDARMAVTFKATGSRWTEGKPTPQAAWTVTRVAQSDSRHLTAEAAWNGGVALRISLALDPEKGDLTVALGGNWAAEIGKGIQYPTALYPSDGSGYAVLPLFGGYLVPTSETNWKAPWPHSRMEWFGGTDGKMAAGWMYIAEPAADMELVVANCEVAGRPRLGGALQWIGSNANPGAHPGRLSYERRAILHFFGSGGYVAQAKYFRAYAERQGWRKSLREKMARNPELERLIGAPVIYLWGDGRSVQMLHALKQAGIQKALIQLSINHLDPSGAFPNREFHDGDGWSKAVRADGYVPGIYDIYAAARPRRPGPPPPGGRRYSGFSYLWPSNVADWDYVEADGGREPRPSVSHQMSAQFALQERLPALIRQFGFDAFFFDTVCAVEPKEDYDTEHGHPASRAQDIAHRIALLDAASGHFNKLTGTEQIKSWGVPYVDWAEGMFRLGSSAARGQYGAWNNDVYPQVVVDVTDLGAQLKTVLNTGFQVPLWELVYHEDLISVQHWHLTHDKLLYCWDFADEFALLRGQAPILSLVYAGETGRSGRIMGQATDATTGKVWDTRWTNPLVAARVAKTYQSVSQWQEQVAEWEMTDHRLLTADYSVQLSEFSGDGGRSGKGIVVNLGNFDGAHSMTGPTWKGEIRGQPLVVPVNGYQEYTW